MIQINNLKKYFGDFLVLDDITCEFKEGYIYGLIGINGAGKSTLLRHIAGIYKQDSGQILYKQNEMFDNASVKKDIMFLSDSPSFFYNYSISDMRKYYSTFYDFDNEVFDKLNKIFSLDIKKNINKFSKGMKKQVELMLGICCNPKVLILDETFDGLDPIISNKIKKILIELVEEKGITLIISSHSLSVLDSLSDYIYLLDNNKLSIQKDLKDENNYYKIQLFFDKEEYNNNLDQYVNFNILEYKKVGSVTYLVVDDIKEKIEEELIKLNPIIFEILPFTFEEKFIYQYGGDDVE